jgi:hypothetical protein
VIFEIIKLNLKIYFTENKDHLIKIAKKLNLNTPRIALQNIKLVTDAKSSKYFYVKY